MSKGSDSPRESFRCSGAVQLKSPMRALRPRETYRCPIKGDLKAHLGHLNGAPDSGVQAAVPGQPLVVSKYSSIQLLLSQQSTCVLSIRPSHNPTTTLGNHGFTRWHHYFERTPIKGGFQYRCILCNGRTMRDTTRHKNSEYHQAMVAGEEASVARNRDNEHHLASSFQNDDEANDDVPQFVGFEEDDNTAAEPERSGYTEALMKLLTEPYSDSEDSNRSGEDEDSADLVELNFEEILWKRLREDKDLSESDSASEESSEAEALGESGHSQPKPAFDSDWYPFSKEQVAGLLLLGSGRHILSEKQYNRCRFLYRLNIIRWESSLQNPCYGLSIKEIVAQELANPIVTKHLVFIPEYEPNGQIDRLSQSKKWPEEFSWKQRVQMVPSVNGHFFLYEPVCQTSGQWIVPIFFFQQSGRVYAKCLKALIVSQGTNSELKIIVDSCKEFNSSFLITVSIESLKETFIDSKDNQGLPLEGRCGGVMYQRNHANDGYHKIPLPNPWRNDTSGNVSKKWNKHMSYYFTLSGLPPGMTNQEYNIHFLATSNKSSALELGDHEGPQLREWTETKAQTFELWNLLRNPRKFTEFMQKSKEYGICDTMNVQHVERFHELHRSKEYSNEEVKKMFDDLNEKFGERLFNPFLRLEGFDAHKDTPVKILHVVLLGVVKYLFRDAMDNIPDSALPSILAQWKSFDTAGLNVPPIQPKTMTQFYQSLVGKDFRTIIQAVPFVLYEHISYERQRMWTALAHLSSFIFQTQITNLASYTKDLKILVNIFLGHIIQWTAQWTNKPKFHMLVHLVESIKRFGPLSLVATERNESFNGVTRLASVHSNRHDPGLYIATTFLFAKLMRLLLSGGYFWDSKYQCQVRAGKEVVKLFLNNEWVQNSFAYNQNWDLKGSISMKETFIYIKAPNTIFASTLIGDMDEMLAPDDLKMAFPKFQWSQKREARLETGQRVHSKNFVFLHLPGHENVKVGQIESFWEGRNNNNLQFLAKLNVCSMDEEIDSFYGFRGLNISKENFWMPLAKIKCVLNVQHNCHLAKCQPQSTPPRHNGQMPVKSPYQIEHRPVNKYILNSGALYSAEYHRSLANIKYTEWTNHEWNECIEIGISSWKITQEKKDKAKQEKMSKDNVNTEKSKGKKRKYQNIDPSLFEI
ncbi:hypothetical protein DFH28DRAFT_1108148 [Melampsora americana]|nr:hypothetical protein DFH28DRAFT_1108148 [Melampsora americana]